MTRLPLDDVRVIDLSMWWAGPMATRLLADMGAEVIKIESLKRIDPWRGPVVSMIRFGKAVGGVYPNNDPGERPYNRSAAFNLQNRNKYGISLDLSRFEGKDILKRLVYISDVIVENFTPRVMTSLGLDYTVLEKVNPRIIMLSMPAYGMTGPEKDYRGFGQTIECMSGITYLTGYLGEGPMLQSGIAYGDPIAGINGAFAVLAALHHRSGKGMYIELSQVEVAIPLNSAVLMDYTMNRRIRTRMGNRHQSMAPQGCYRCKGDDAWVVIAVPSDEVWHNFCHAVGKPALSEDRRFFDVAARLRHQDELDPIIEEWTKEHDHYEVMRIMQAAGVPAGPALDARELVEEAHLNERGFFEVVTHPEAGTHPYIGMSAKFSKTPGSIRRPAPCFGEHNQYVFGELLGLSKEEITRLEEAEIIGSTPSTEQLGGMF